MILHICPEGEWVKAAELGTYEGDTFALQGFIHCSTPEQVHIPATLRFRGRRDLLLLVIDEARLPVPVTWEQGDPPTPDRRLFPHLYARLPVGAVVAVHEYRPGPDGTFAPPTDLK